MEADLTQPMEQWFALRVTYCRELKLKRVLDDLGVGCFVPMKTVKRPQGERLVKRQVPSVHNLVFVRCTRQWLADFKSRTELPVRYIMDRSRRVPLVVPDRQMESFIAVAGSGSEEIVYLPSDEQGLKRGDRVRIIAGLFAGAEGVLLRVKGDRRVVVDLCGLVAVATAFVHPSMIEKIT